MKFFTVSYEDLVFVSDSSLFSEEIDGDAIEAGLGQDFCSKWFGRDFLGISAARITSMPDDMNQPGDEKLYLTVDLFVRAEGQNDAEGMLPDREMLNAIASAAISAASPQEGAENPGNEGDWQPLDSQSCDDLMEHIISIRWRDADGIVKEEEITLISPSGPVAIRLAAEWLATDKYAHEGVKDPIITILESQNFKPEDTFDVVTAPAETQSAPPAP